MTPTPTNPSGLFTQLEPLLAHRAVLITVSKLEDGLLQVNICPRQLKESENSALTIPLCVTGSAAELDAELVSQVSSFVSVQTGLSTNLTAIEQEIAAAEKAAREEAKKKSKTAGNGGRKATDSAPAEPNPTPEPEQPSMATLFDQVPLPLAAAATQPGVHAN